MITSLIFFAAFFFFFHLFFENLTVFAKYNMAANSRFMQGVTYSNYFSISSRISISIFGLIISYVVESGENVQALYTELMIIVLLLAGLVSYIISFYEINLDGELIKVSSWLKKINIKECSLPKVGNYEAIFFGMQFAAVAIAYGASFIYPEYRLTIVATVPFISMLGTIVSLVIVEPKYAKIIDENPRSAVYVSRILLKARAKSFFFTCFLLFIFIYINS